MSVKILLVSCYLVFSHDGIEAMGVMRSDHTDHMVGFSMVLQGLYVRDFRFRDLLDFRWLCLK